jgi:regulator of nucleoside diphosphate kinase
MAKGTMTKEATIYITEIDRNRLRKLIELARDTGADSYRRYLDRLEDELERAEVAAPNDIPRDVVTMRSRVRLKDLDNGKEMGLLAGISQRGRY